MREHATEAGDIEVPDTQSLLGWALPEDGAQVPSLAWLVARLRDSRPDWGLLESLTRFDDARYARRTLARTRACELLLVCWLPGQGSPLHDHGGSWGASLLLQGELRETRFAWAGDRLRVDAKRRAGEGDLMREESHTIHRVLNDSRHRAVSLHVYAPPMEGMTSYDDVWAESVRRRRPAAVGAGRRRRPRAG
ncbi:cysteine dioxygenase [Myxococcus stipitatus DSM 14675]|uniref:Cysteine dioxygenase n=1 Tax=Myxococcus stipitatus (strain DSM 14675 / JCM 12634 / Mx s8) TaxID=1278073 RepID=L7U3Y4_MYXSD|nr:cysteine dioxygenase family protein [Myxococcus stipitatus]AGC42297.1 cysteine dioxygenase [Myxococcus stipitatus DSM 14675]